MLPCINCSSVRNSILLFWLADFRQSWKPKFFTNAARPALQTIEEKQLRERSHAVNYTDAVERLN